MTFTLKATRIGSFYIDLEVDKRGVYSVSVCEDLGEPFLRTRNQRTYGSEKSARDRYNAMVRKYKKELNC